jgi:DNA-binding IclR family transcriptional regulator
MEMARWFGQGTYANDERRTEKCEYAQIISALMIGHIEERPFCSSKLATYLDMPRASVTRKLAKLVKEGIVKRNGRHFYLAPAAIDNDLRSRNIIALVRAVKRAARAMAR